MSNLLWAGRDGAGPGQRLRRLLRQSKAKGGSGFADVIPQLLGEELQGIIRLDIGKEKVGKCEL